MGSILAPHMRLRWDLQQGFMWANAYGSQMGAIWVLFLILPKLPMSSQPLLNIFLILSSHFCFIEYLNNFYKAAEDDKSAEMQK